MSLFKRKERTLENTVLEESHTASVLSPLPLSHRLWAKFLAFILIIFMAAITAGCVLGAYAMVMSGVYTTSEDEMRSDIYGSMADDVAYKVAHFIYTADDEKAAEAYLSGKNVSGAVVYTDNGNISGNSEKVLWTYGKAYASPSHFTFEYRWDFSEDSEMQFIRVRLYIPHEPSIRDTLYFVDRALSFAYDMRYAVYVIGILSAIAALASFVFLMYSSGRRNGLTKVQPGWGTWVPADLLTALCGGAALFVFLLFDGFLYRLSGLGSAVFCCALILALGVVFLGWCMSMALRLKMDGWWKNTVTYVLLRFSFKILSKIGSCIKSIFKWVWSAVSYIPLFWKTAAIFSAVSILEFFVIILTWWEHDVLFIFWVLEHIILFLIVMTAAAMMSKLHRAAAAMAGGDLDHKVDTSKMVLDLKAHGEYLNSINDGISVAVEQRTRSERMKTELITNVSHDIKTPLTSIINYADLIEKDPDNVEKVKEYASVLHRQSDRLKRLIDDLVEASKASTGNIDIQLSPCNVGVMLAQTAGEYEQKMKDVGLELITRQEKDPVFIMADGRRLWRVFDNLMGNICKYALTGTRVYLTLERKDGHAVISFKNTSREPLDLTADELMERFVRGDSSRSSEGNGLGLSIAGSLTQLQNGRLELIVDGDLFKAILHFPLIN